jgi:hypothetical protein
MMPFFHGTIVPFISIKVCAFTKNAGNILFQYLLSERTSEIFNEILLVQSQTFLNRNPDSDCLMKSGKTRARDRNRARDRASVTSANC